MGVRLGRGPRSRGRGRRASAPSCGATSSLHPSPARNLLTASKQYDNYGPNVHAAFVRIKLMMMITSEKAWEKRNVLSLDLKTATESLLRTVFGSELQTANAERRKVCFVNVVVVEG